MTAVGFVRGEQFVEIVSRDPATGDLNFYLLSFEQSVQLRQRRLRSGEPAHRRASSTTGPRTASTIRTTSSRRRSTASRVISPAGPARSASCACRSSPARGCTGSRSASSSARTPTASSARSSPTRTGTTSNTAASPSTSITNARRRRQRRAARGARARRRVRRAAESVRRADRRRDEERHQPDLAGALRHAPRRRRDRGALPAHRRDRRGEADRCGPLVPGRGPRRCAARDAARHPATCSPTTRRRSSASFRSPAPTARPSCCRCARAATTDAAIPQLSKSRFNVRRLDEMTARREGPGHRRGSATSGATRMPPWRVGGLTPEAIRAATAELQK